MTFFRGGWEIGGKKFSKFTSHRILEMDEVFKKSSSLKSTKHGNLKQVFRALAALWTLYWELLLRGKTVLYEGSKSQSICSIIWVKSSSWRASSSHPLPCQWPLCSAGQTTVSVCHKTLFTARSTCIDRDQEPLWCVCLTVESESNSNSSKIQDKWCFS